MKKEEGGNAGRRQTALNIKNPETEKLARELARRRGQGITEAVTEVLVAEAEPLLFKGTDFGATDVEVVRLG